MFHIYSFHFGIISRSIRTEVFLKMVFLKISQNSQENTCTGVSYLSATSIFINEETPTLCFPKALTIFAKSSIVDVQLGYKLSSRSKTELERLSFVKVSDKNCYCVMYTTTIDS